jgi:hypothetical protein
MKAVLIVMVILTVIYVSAVAYTHAYPHVVVDLAAYKYEADTTPVEWYTPEELGIVEIYKFGEEHPPYALKIVVDPEKAPFLSQSETPIFLYKDEFYIVAYPPWITFRPANIEWRIPIGAALGAGWVFTGVLFLEVRKRERKRWCWRC